MAHRLSALISTTILTIALAASGAEIPAEVLLQRAMHKQMVDGDLEEAIRLYREIAEDHADNRSVAAKALVQMGRCYEKLGKDEARKAYERVVRDYSDQALQVSEARERLASLQQPAAGEPATLATRRIWQGAEVNSLGAPTKDGRFITATDWNTGNVIIRDLVSGRVRSLSGKSGWDSREFAMYSVPSPDGTLVAYAWGYSRYDLRVTRADGLATRVLTSAHFLQPMSWTPDGKAILTLVWNEEGSVGAVLFSASGGPPRKLETFASGMRGVPTRMSFSPDGRFLVYDLGRESSLRRDIFVRSLASDEEHPLVENPANHSFPLWSPDGQHVLFVTDRGGVPALWAIAVAEGKPAGEPRLIKSDMGRIYPSGITREGTLFYTLEVGSNDIYEATLDPETGKMSGKPRLVTSRYAGSNSNPAWSPDGSSFCYVSRRGLTIGGDANQANVLVIRGLDGEEREIEPNALSRFHGPLWTPDGKRILVIGRPRSGQGNNGVYSIDVASGEVRPLLVEWSSWINGHVLSPDGSTLYFGRQLGGEEGFALVRRDLETGEETILHRPEDQGGLGLTLAISPDGAFLATRVWWVTGERFNAIRIIPTTPGGDSRDPLGTEKAYPLSRGAVVFSRDGRHLLFARKPNGSGESELWRVPVDGGEAAPLGL
ncbi:MAG TPA: tetratricopeptide repeat protein, partial [Thermoanaerobaculia bacterium]|nr:tetratricopeptide repeat protein [Thermoanaerobaculia bacterium]